MAISCDHAADEVTEVDPELTRGRAVDDPEADAALFASIETALKQTADRRLVRLPLHINDRAFSAVLVETFREIVG